MFASSKQMVRPEKFPFELLCAMWWSGGPAWVSQCSGKLSVLHNQKCLWTWYHFYTLSKCKHAHEECVITLWCCIFKGLEVIIHHWLFLKQALSFIHSRHYFKRFPNVFIFSLHHLSSSMFYLLDCESATFLSNPQSWLVTKATKWGRTLLPFRLCPLYFSLNKTRTVQSHSKVWLKISWRNHITCGKSSGLLRSLQFIMQPQALPHLLNVQSFAVRSRKYRGANFGGDGCKREHAWTPNRSHQLTDCDHGGRNIV